MSRLLLGSWGRTLLGPLGEHVEHSFKVPHHLGEGGNQGL